MDAEASHHITFNLNNLLIHSEHNEGDDILLGDGRGSPITHIGSTSFKPPSKTFTSMSFVLLSFTKTYSLFLNFANTIIPLLNFFPNCFVVNDMSIRALLV